MWRSFGRPPTHIQFSRDARKLNVPLDGCSARAALMLLSLRPAPRLSLLAFLPSSDTTTSPQPSLPHYECPTLSIEHLSMSCGEHDQITWYEDGGGRGKCTSLQNTFTICHEKFMMWLPPPYDLILWSIPPIWACSAIYSMREIGGG